MARILVIGEPMQRKCVATMIDVGDDGLRTWRATCGTRSEYPQSPWDAINDAEAHVDRCTR